MADVLIKGRGERENKKSIAYKKKKKKKKKKKNMPVVP
jgi:hypothetical protein